MVAVLAAGAGAVPVDRTSSVLAQPALGVFPPNATRVVAKVLKHGTATAEYLPAQPEIAEGTTLDVLTLAIEDTRQARPDLPVGPATGTLEVSSRDRLSPALVGHHIEAILTIVGTTRASRWLISDIRPLPE